MRPLDMQQHSRRVSIFPHPYGVNAWLHIPRKLKEVYDLLDFGREDEANCIMSAILEMPHNTGKVSEKLKNLDSC